MFFWFQMELCSKVILFLNVSSPPHQSCGLLGSHEGPEINSCSFGEACFSIQYSLILFLFFKYQHFSELFVCYVFPLKDISVMKKHSKGQKTLLTHLVKWHEKSSHLGISPAWPSTPLFEPTVKWRNNQSELSIIF